MYKRKIDKGNIPKNMEFACKEVILEGKSVRSSRLKYNISYYKILDRYVTKLKAAGENLNQISNIQLTHVDYIKSRQILNERNCFTGIY